MLFNSNGTPVFHSLAVMTFSFPLPSSTFMPEVALYQLEPPVREAVYRAAVFVYALKVHPSNVTLGRGALTPPHKGNGFPRQCEHWLGMTRAGQCGHRPLRCGTSGRRPLRNGRGRSYRANRVVRPYKAEQEPCKYGKAPLQLCRRGASAYTQSSMLLRSTATSKGAAVASLI